jgi:hypothetical protein
MPVAHDPLNGSTGEDVPQRAAPVLAQDNQIHVTCVRDPEHGLEGIALLDQRDGGEPAEFRKPGHLVSEKRHRLAALDLDEAARLVVIDGVNQQEFRSTRRGEERTAPERPIGARRQIRADEETL